MMKKLCMYDLDHKDDEKISKFHFIKKIIVHTDFFYTSLSRKFKRVRVMKIGGKTTTIITSNIRGTTSSKVRDSALGEDRIFYSF